MTYRLVFAQEAEKARDGIIDYLLNTLQNKQAAQHFMDAFDEALSLVCSSPEMHALSKEPNLARKGYRPCLFMNYIALYKIENNTIMVAHIFHSSQDYAKLV